MLYLEKNYITILLNKTFKACFEKFYKDNNASSKMMSSNRVLQK